MRLRLLAVSLLCVVAANAGAQAKKAQPGKSPELRIDITRETLPNGLNVIYHVDHSTPVAAVLLWYNVGSKVEQPGHTGFAHLFEHMMFQGSKNVAKGQHWALLEAAGGRGGADINGTTNWDRTNYFEQVPSNQVELALWLEADRMGTLLDAMDQTKLDNQREVVKNERRQSMDNQPYGTWLEKMGEALFPEGHPYHHSLLGDIIGSGRSSRLYDALVRRQQIATNVSAFNLGLSSGADELIFVATGKPGASADSLEVAMMAELAGASSFTQSELERARATERFGFVNGLQTTGGFGGRADRLAEGWTFFHDPNHVNKVLGEYDRVTLDDLNGLARER